MSGENWLLNLILCNKMLAFVVIESLLETLLTSQLHILGGCEEFNGPEIWGRYKVVSELSLTVG